MGLCRSKEKGPARRGEYPSVEETHRWRSPSVEEPIGGGAHRWRNPSVEEPIGGGTHRWRNPSVEEPIQGDRKGRPYYIRLPFDGCEVRSGAVPWYSRGGPRGRPGDCSRSAWK